MLETVCMKLARFLYFPLLAWLAYLYFPAEFRVYYWGVVFLFFGVQVAASGQKSGKPLKAAGSACELLGAYPLLLAGKAGVVAMMAGLVPAFSLGSLFGPSAGAGVMVLVLAGGGVGMLEYGPSSFWPSYGAAAALILTLYSAAGSRNQAKAFTDERGFLDDLGKKLEEEEDANPLLQWLLEKTVAFVNAEFGALYFWDDKSGKLKREAFTGKFFMDAHQDPLEVFHGTLESVAKERKENVISDLSLDPRFSHDSGGSQMVRSIVCIPVGRAQGSLGALVCGSALSRAYSSSETAVLSLFARYISLVMDRQDRGLENERKKWEHEAIFACTKTLISSSSIETSLRMIAGYTQKILDIKDWTLFLFSPQKEEFFAFLSTTAFVDEIYDLKIKMGEGAISQSVAKNEPLIIPDIAKTPFVGEKENRGGRFLSIFIFPLVDGDKIVGAIQLSDSVQRTLSAEEIQFAECLGHLAVLLFRGQTVEALAPILG